MNVLHRLNDELLKQPFDSNSPFQATLSPEEDRQIARTYGALLSEREKEILQLLAHGKTSNEIASSLSISLHRVNRHRQNIPEKPGVKNSVEACRIIE